MKPMTDALSQILDHLKLTGSVYFHTEFHQPWGIRVPARQNVVRFHMAMRGECYVRIQGVQDLVPLSAKDLIVIPHGVSHEIIDTENGAVHDLSDVIQANGFTGNGALRVGNGLDLRPCRLICGHFEFHDGANHPILNALPDYLLLIDQQSNHSPTLAGTMQIISSEILAPHAGTDAIVHRLAEVIFINAIRHFVSEQGEAAGILSAFLDPKLSLTLSAVHKEPDHGWTVENMAAVAGMSRTVFAERFRNLVGMTPLEYVLDWRMRVAYRHMEESDLPIPETAALVGYGSEASFVRAFKREFGKTPGQVRRGFR